MKRVYEIDAAALLFRVSRIAINEIRLFACLPVCWLNVPSYLASMVWAVVPFTPSDLLSDAMAGRTS